MGEVQRFWAGSLHSVEPDRLLYGIYVREQVVFASDYDALKTRLYEVEMQSRGNWIDAEQLAASLNDCKERLTKLENLLERIDNCDAITIDRDFPEADVSQAESIWDDIHDALSRK